MYIKFSLTFTNYIIYIYNILLYLCVKETNINSCNLILNVMRHFGNGPSGSIIALDLSAVALSFFLSQSLSYHYDSRIMIYFRLRLMLGCKWTFGRCLGVHCTRGDIHRRTSRARRMQTVFLFFFDIDLLLLIHEQIDSTELSPRNIQKIS